MSGKLTDDRLAEIRAADAARTQGEWEQDDGDGDSPGVFADDLSAICMMGDDGLRGLRPTSMADAAFIALCSTAVPAFLDHIDALEDDCKRYRTCIQNMLDEAGQFAGSSGYPPEVRTGARLAYDRIEPYARAALAKENKKGGDIYEVCRQNRIHEC